jgi:carboxypeptidase T
MVLHHVTILAGDREAALDLVRRYHVAVTKHAVTKTRKGLEVDAHATAAQIRRLKAAGYEVQQLENATKAGRLRQKEVRAEAALAPATEALEVSLARHYLNVADVEAALAAAAGPPNSAFTSLIALPNKTWEGRTCSAIRIGKPGRGIRPAIYLLGGVHAREWGSPDILINFVQLLTQAYRTGTGITIGKKSFSPGDVKSLVEHKDIYVFAQANPDGRNYSMTQDPMWRKNRRAAPAGSNCAGVDVNRNYDFLWDYPARFSPSAAVQNSTQPCSEVYIGPGVESEPETKNAVWMFDRFPQIRYFVDLHSYSESILYSWGDDQNQTTTATMNFRNAAFDTARGVGGDAYKEFIPASDLSTSIELAKALQTGIKSCRGRTYTLKPSFDLYPTAGTSGDYAFARHLTNAQRTKVFAYTVEWGSTANPTPFHPAYTEMQKIIQEVTAGLLAFCIAAPS